ncbi:MAG: cryptochrome/photolyase family protein [Kiritimatiellia bacterium]
MSNPSPVRNLLLILGDQLNQNSAVFDGYSPEQDLVWMAETQEESTHVWCHQIRLVLFFSAMRHFRDEILSSGKNIRYQELSEDPGKDRGENFAEILKLDLQELHPARIRVVQPGDLRVEKMLRGAADAAGIPLEILPDRHFYVTPEDFQSFAKGRKSLVMEHFYRLQRKKHQVLVDTEGQPEGGAWNFDEDNRKSFGKEGPPSLPRPPLFQPDSLTKEVIRLVQTRFKTHPGNLEHFDWPVSAGEAQEALQDFIDHRLPHFGSYEDAMWKDQALLYHSRLSPLLNMKLLDPRDCIGAAVDAYRVGKAPLNSVEGFVRQILGWREFIRGIYFQEMPEYAEKNALECGPVDVPTFFWDGKTDMACVADCMESVLDHAWTHHIPRLMVLGQFSLLLGVHPYKFHEWHMAMYADAVDWVSLPNTLGMSQYGDGGIVGTKPYCASGNYINKMSNYCGNCRYSPGKSSGKDACPFTTLYWDFLDRHRGRFSGNHRMGFQIKNLERKKAEELRAIRERAEELRETLRSGGRI